MVEAEREQRAPFPSTPFSRAIQSPYPGLTLRFSSPSGLINFAAISLVHFPSLPRRETDETFFIHKPSINI